MNLNTIEIVLYLVSGYEREGSVSPPSLAYLFSRISFHYAGRQSGGSGLGVSSLGVKGPSPADSCFLPFFLL